MESLRRQLEEIKSAIGNVPQHQALREEIDRALASNDATCMRNALKKFDLLETTVIHRLRTEEQEDRLRPRD